MIYPSMKGFVNPLSTYQTQSIQKESISEHEKRSNFLKRLLASFWDGSLLDK